MAGARSLAFLVPFSLVIALSGCTKSNISHPTPSGPLAISPSTTLPVGYVGSNYSQTLTASGGSGAAYTWAVSSGSSLPAGLSLSSAGVISGKPTEAATSSFGIRVTDSAQNTGSAKLSLTVDPGLAISTASLPSGYPGAQYTATTLAATGGSSSGYSWSWAAAAGSSLPAGLNLSPGGVLSGTPTTPGSYGAVVTVSDSARNTASATFPVTVEAVLSVTSPATLPSAPINILYSQQLTASGGSGHGFQWKVTSGQSMLQTLSLSLSSAGVLQGTPPASGSASFTAQVTDSEDHSVSAPLSVTILQGYSVSGQISILNGCPGATQPPIAVSINTDPVEQTTTDSSGNFTLPSVPSGSYLITPSVAGAESIFTPSAAPVTVDNAAVTGQMFIGYLAFTISGTVSYVGPQKGPVFFTLTGCGNGLGTSTYRPSYSGAAFTIRGVPYGISSLRAVLDGQGYGYPVNESFPSGSIADIPVTGANVTGLAVTLTDPAPYAITAAPQIKFISPLDQGALLAYNPITGTDSSGNPIEVPPSYRIQWNTTGDFSSVPSANNFIFPAGKGDGTGIVFLTNSTLGVTGAPFTNGQPLYFRIQGYIGADNPNNGPWANFPGNPITIGALSGANEIDGQIAFTGQATGPLYVGFLNSQTGQFYGQSIPNPSSPQPYKAFVPTGNAYKFVAVVQNYNDGFIGPGDFTNVRNNGYSIVDIAGPKTGMDLTLPAENSTVFPTTRYMKWSNPAATGASYGIGLELVGQNGIPNAVELVSGSNILYPFDIGRCFTCGNIQFQYNSPMFPTPPMAPFSGGTYSLSVIYDGAKPETKTASIPGLFTDVATALMPQQNIGVSSTPTFSWNYPASDTGSYLYRFALSDENGAVIWLVPGANSNTSGFTQAQIPSTSGGSGIPWGADPTDPANTPSVPALTSGATYTWSIATMDVKGNTATRQMWFMVP